MPKAKTTTSGLPTARHHFQSGTSGDTCIDYNRSCKAYRIATAAARLGYGPYASDAQIDQAADAAGVNRPGGDETRNAVRACLQTPLHDGAAAQFIVDRVVTAAEIGHPFPFVTESGDTVLLVPLPMGE